MAGFVLLGACAAVPGGSPTTPPSAPASSNRVSVPTSTSSSTSTSTSAPVPASTTTTTTLPALQGLALKTLATGLAQPTVVTHAPGDESLYVAERTGVIRVVEPETGLVEEPFLDLSDRVGSNGIEQGMLGLAFHPADADRFFVYYVDTDGRRTLSQFGESAPGSERLLFAHPQPPGSVDIRHYGGNLEFGPDGYLYASLGDGADAGNQGQNPDSIFGTILRLDVDGDPYTVPSDNPFPDGDAPEVWAYGLRNPWRFTIDDTDRLIYIADVGQERWEEVNVLSLDEGGANLGWPVMEGNHCFSRSNCDPDEFTTPSLEYGHEEGCSITGGHVYRGEAMPELAGHYFYGDWCGGWVRSFRAENGNVTDSQDWTSDLEGLGQPNAFGLDAAGEMYVATYEGEVLAIVPVR